MTNYLLTLFLFVSFLRVNAQFNWQNSSGGPTGFWDMDTLNGKFYVSSGVVNEFDGSNWTVLDSYNQSYNTPNKTKSSVKTIDGKLYCGAKDFNSSGEGAVHYYDGSSWTLFQNTDIPYNGDYKIRDFEKFNGSIYMSGKFRLPTDLSYYGLAKWDGTEWVNAGKNFATTYDGSIYYPMEIFEMEVFQNKLYVTDRDNIWFYDGLVWDSLFHAYTTPVTFPLGNVNSMIVYNNELYMCGSFSLDMTNINLKMVKYNGSSFSTIDGAAGLDGIYDNIGRLSLVNNLILFAAHKISDNNTYLVSYNGSSFTELTKLADYGDWPYAAGSEYTNYSKMMYYNGSLWIGGNFQKIGGQSLTGLVYSPYTFSSSSGNITQPAALSTFTPGNDVQFSWDVDNVTSIVLEYSDDNESTWNTIANNIPSGNQKTAVTGQYTWTVPSISASQIIVRLKDYDSGIELNRNTYNISSGTTSLTDPRLFNLKVYPNPSHGIFMIEGEGQYVVEVRNALGEKVYSGPVDGSQLLDLSANSRGIYSCRFISGKKSSSLKLIIE